MKQIINCLGPDGAFAELTLGALLEKSMYV